MVIWNTRAVRRPRVILVTGEPGSGKTTLGVELARALRLPFLARDDVRGGLFFTAGSWTDRPGAIPPVGEAVEATLRTVEAMAGLGVSCVVEYVVRQHRPVDLARIDAVAECVVVRTWCTDPMTRFTDRERADPLLNRQPVLDALGCGSIDEHTARAAERMRSVAAEMRTDFDQSTLLVNTDDGYDPGLDRIIEFATAP